LEPGFSQVFWVGTDVNRDLGVLEIIFIVISMLLHPYIVYDNKATVIER